MHGHADARVGLRQSEHILRGVAAAGVDAALHVVPGANHAGPEFDSAEAPAGAGIPGASPRRAHWPHHGEHGRVTGATATASRRPSRTYSSPTPQAIAHRERLAHRRRNQFQMICAHQIRQRHRSQARNIRSGRSRYQADIALRHNHRLRLLRDIRLMRGSEALAVVPSGRHNGHYERRISGLVRGSVLARAGRCGHHGAAVRGLPAGTVSTRSSRGW
jgi:hypothetical protein